MFLITTLSFGFKRPEDGDKGDVFFPALEDNITQVNNHDHDGVTADKVKPFSLEKARTQVPSTGWAESPASSGRYRQLVTLPAGYSLDTDATTIAGIPTITFYLNGGVLDGQPIDPVWERVTDTTFYLYMPDNAQAVDIIYG